MNRDELNGAIKVLEEIAEYILAGGAFPINTIKAKINAYRAALAALPDPTAPCPRRGERGVILARYANGEIGIGTACDLLNAPDPWAALAEAEKALEEAYLWIPDRSGQSPFKRGAKADTLSEVIELVQSTLATIRRVREGR